MFFIWVGKRKTSLPKTRILLTTLLRWSSQSLLLKLHMNGWPRRRRCAASGGAMMIIIVESKRLLTVRNGCYWHIMAISFTDGCWPTMIYYGLATQLGLLIWHPYMILVGNRTRSICPPLSILLVDSHIHMVLGHYPIMPSWSSISVHVPFISCELILDECTFTNDDGLTNSLWLANGVPNDGERQWLE